jgi:hypothetical protein
MPYGLDLTTPPATTSSSGGFSVGPQPGSADWYDQQTAAAAAKKRYDDAQKGIFSNGASGDTSSMFDWLDRAMDKQFDYSGKTMDRTHGYRVKEGQTQGQMDEQAFRRLDRSETGLNTRQTAQIESQKYLQQRGADLTNWQRDKDKDRAVSAFNRFR